MIGSRESRASGFAVTVLTIVIAACGTSPTAPDPRADLTTQVSGVRVVGGPVIDMTPGESRPLEIEETSPSAATVRHPSSSYTWSSSDTNVAAIDATGTMRAGPALGSARITARSSAGVETAALVWVQPPETIPSSFRITLVYGDGIPEEWRPRFRSAADRWERVVRASLPAIDLGAAPPRQDAWCHGLPGSMFGAIETGTRVFVGRHENVGTGGGVCVARPAPFPTSAVGWIKVGGLNEPAFLPSGFLTLHEMGHALGLVGVFPPPHPSWVDPSARRYSGPLALEGHRRQFGSTVDSLSLSNGHWLLFEDVMSATQRQTTTITRVSVGALMDLGYPAAWYGAGDR
jgi:hypothetical protein